jgi:16S rRNA (cytosine1402-N4)-methyltransferase
MTGFHRPVLLSEVISAFEPLPGKTIIDATVGGAGHAKEMVRRGANVLGIDADPDAVKRAMQELNQVPGGTWKIVQGNFRDLKEIVAKVKLHSIDGILMDLGVSSFQIDNPNKGFRYLDEATKLDMRFDPSVGQTAGDILAQKSCDELYEIFSYYGEEKRARAISMAIVRARAVNQIEYAGQLTDLIGRLVSPQEKVGTMARIFQALRIAVNDELGSLKKGLSDANDLLKINGIICIISFHSLEDRIVKLYFRQSNNLVEITKKPITASQAEIEENSRSRSAKLRIAMKEFL